MLSLLAIFYKSFIMPKIYKRKRNRLQELTVDFKTIIYIRFQKSNVIITITNIQGKTIDWFSSGSIGFSGFRKASPLAAKELARKLYEKVRTYELKDFILKVKGFNEIKKAVLKYIALYKLKFSKMYELTMFPLNGCKPQKRRKL